jgi:NADH-quinone oxidoreductase subunit F
LDLHFTNDQASAQERQAVDALLGPAESSAAAPRDRLLPALHSLNERIGWISPGALNYVCRRLGVPPAEAYGVASFYGLFSTAARAPRVVHVCDDIACTLAGADRLCARLEQSWPAGQSRGSPSTWVRSPCLGLCDRAPAALVSWADLEAPGQLPMTHASTEDVLAALTGHGRAGAWSPADTGSIGQSRLLRRVGKVDPERLADYEAAGGFTALRKALSLERPRVVAEVIDSKLVGRGGAAFPTGRKWEAVAREPAQPHYVVCNADESEPGTFKDRVLLEEDPFAVLEGMVIAAYAGGATQGYIYLRGEYPVAAARLRAALASMHAAGLLGRGIAGSSFDFNIELRRGAGAYVCGEETALFNSIEGLRGEPRNKPPFPAQKGLFAKPTIVNNVETLANVPDIINQGGASFAAIGTAASTGTKLFCLCGHVARPGLYEVPFGTKLSALLNAAGGAAGGRKIQAVLLGGAAGIFLTPRELEVELSFEGARALGASIGSGVVMVLDESADLASILLRIAAFFRDESCGQCVPCRVGTVRQEELLHRLASNRLLGSRERERALLADIGQVMRDASICGLGQTASSAIESALAKFEVFKDA